MIAIAHLARPMPPSPARPTPRPATGGFARALGGTVSTAGPFGLTVATPASPALALNELAVLPDRRRVAARAGRLLDLLEELQAALLGETAEAAPLEALARLLAEAPPASGDQALDALARAIELRVAVERAKLERA